MNSKGNDEIQSIPSIHEKEVVEDRRRKLIKVWKETGNHKKEATDFPKVEQAGENGIYFEA